MPGQALFVRSTRKDLYLGFTIVLVILHKHKPILGKPSIKKTIFLLTFVNKRGRGGLERASSIKKP